MSLLERLYAAASNAGLLQACRWQPSDGSPPQTHPVGFAAPDEGLFDGLASSTEYVIRYPATALRGLAAREPVEIDGVTYLVREVRALGDGSERRALLTRV